MQRMIPTVLFCGSLGWFVTGCQEADTPLRRQPALPGNSADEPVPVFLRGLPSRPLEPESSAPALAPSVNPLPVPTPTVPRVLIEGTFNCSGWMGDAAEPNAAVSLLKRSISSQSPATAPNCERWEYLPPTGWERQGWIGVAWQGPQPNNWGQVKGLDFSSRGFTRLTFLARGERGGESLAVRSGGCTAPGALYPASHDQTLGMIVLKPTWERFVIPLQGCDLSNTCSVFSFTVNRTMAPEGCVFYLDEIALEGDDGQGLPRTGWPR